MTNGPKVLSIGSIVGGHTSKSRVWTDAITRLTHSVVAAREGLASDVRLNVEFHVPGDILQPDFRGLRTGTFRKADQLLKVQVALPDEPPSDPYVYVVGAVGEAINAAALWAQRRGLRFDAECFRALVEHLQD